MRYFFLSLILLGISVSPVQAQVVAPFCGMVDVIDYPIDGLVQGYDDFALYRARFGGNHTGIDIGFDRWGDPVHAAARGQVTYADPEGWDTEKGVVIIEHTFPDGSVAYSLYGHMEQSDTIFFPHVGDCIELGEVVGVIGWPSRGRPHLHFEWRNFLPDDGGPGYVVDSPLSHGWYNPLDFTALWRIRLTSAYVDSTSFNDVLTLPPIRLENGGFVVSSSDVISRLTPEGGVLWQVTTDGVVTGLAALSDDRVVAHTRNGQAVTLQNGRYLALWTVDGPDMPFQVFGETLVFATNNGGLAAYRSDGQGLWSLEGIAGGEVEAFEANGGQVGIAVRGADGVLWRGVDAAGGVLIEAQFDYYTAHAPLPDGGWMVLDGTRLYKITREENTILTTVSPPPGRTARLAVDPLGESYVYLGDSDATLLAIGRDGDVRWRVNIPGIDSPIPPLLTTGGGCLLYMLDTDGRLNVFNTADGQLVNTVQLYAGGRRNTSPGSRLLRADATERIEVAPGYLTLFTLDGAQVGSEALAECRLG